MAGLGVHVAPLLSACILLAVPQVLLARGGQPRDTMCGFVDRALAGPSLNESVARTQKLCCDSCLRRADCASTNYFLDTRLCALHNATHFDSPRELQRKPDSFYAFRQSSVSGSYNCLPLILHNLSTSAWRLSSGTKINAQANDG